MEEREYLHPLTYLRYGTRMPATSTPQPRYNVSERIAANGLKFSTTEYPGNDDEHLLVTERCENFVAEVIRDITLIGSREVCVRKGTLVVLWRSEVIEPSRGYGRGQSVGDVRIHGYGNHGHQSINFNSDEECARHCRSLRTADGKIVKAEDELRVRGWGEAYSRMMSY